MVHVALQASAGMAGHYRTLLVSVKLSLDAGEGQCTCIQSIVLSLSDVLQEVPLLLDLMPSESLAALLPVSQAHRRQIHGHVKHIAVPNQER